MRTLIFLNIAVLANCSLGRSLLYMHLSRFHASMNTRSCQQISRNPYSRINRAKLRGGSSNRLNTASALGFDEPPLNEHDKYLDQSLPESQELSIIFLGTGVSTGIPKLGCIIRPDQSLPECGVCRSALNPHSRNRRCNVSVLLRFRGSDKRVMNVMVDAGKTMREACLRHLPRYGVRGIDALLLTHAHADAILGMALARDTH